MMAGPDQHARFWAKVDRSGGPDSCWPWLGARSDNGYGRVRIEGMTYYAHRVSCAWATGSDIADLPTVDHVCHSESSCPGGLTCPHRLCVNPRHLESVTFVENVRRGRGGANNSVKTHCPQGHPYAGRNLIAYRGRRYCRTCITTRTTARRRALRMSK